MKLKNKAYWAVALVAVLAIAGAAVTFTSRLTAASGSSSTADACSQPQPTTEAPGTETADDNCAGSDAKDANEADSGNDAASAKDANETKDGNDAANAKDATETKDGSADASLAPGQLDHGKDLLPQAGITLDAAVTAAQGAASGTLGAVDLEQHKGKLVFNVEIGGKEVKVDAANGAVLATDTND